MAFKPTHRLISFFTSLQFPNSYVIMILIYDMYRSIMQIRRILMLTAVLALPAYAGDDVTVQLVARDGQFFPTELVAPSGKKIRIELSNEGKDPIEFESKALRKEKVLAPGSKSVIVINPQSAGRYKFVDEFHEATAQGILVVK